MMLNTANNHSIRIVTTISTISAVTVLAVLFYLKYFDRLYDIGNYSTIHVPALIVILEFFKVYIRMMISNTIVDEKENRTIKKSYMKVKMKEIFKCLLLIISTVVVYYIIAVLFGAELFDKCEETLMLTILVASLTVVPSCLNLGAEQTIGFLVGKYTLSDQTKYTLSETFSDMILRNIQLTFLGTWLGAIAIPLDWDRPWQKWPITCCIGALLGNFVSSVFTLIKLLPYIIQIYTGKSLKVNKMYNMKTKI